MTALKILFILLFLLLLFLPLLPLPKKLRRLSTFYKLRYDAPNNRLNFFFVILTILEFVGIALVYGALFTVADTIASIPFIASLMTKASAALSFGSSVIFKVLLLNLVTLYTLVFLKAFVKGALGVLFGFRKKKRRRARRQRTMRPLQRRTIRTKSPAASRCSSAHAVKIPRWTKRQRVRATRIRRSPRARPTPWMRISARSSATCSKSSVAQR